MLKNLMMSPNLEPATPHGWKALVTQNNYLKSETCSSEKSESKTMPSRPHRESTREQEA